MVNRVPFIVSELSPERTRDALKAAKARGRVLGTHGRDVLAPKNRAAALERAHLLEETVRSLRGEGKGVRDIAAAFNERGIATPRDGQWHSTSVHRLLSRLKRAGSQ